MVTWNSKIVSFLSNYNTIYIKNEEEFLKLDKVLKSIGLDLFKNLSFKKLIKDFSLNYDIGFLVEYKNDNGLCLGWKTLEESEGWFGIEPYSLQEVLKEIQG